MTRTVKKMIATRQGTHGVMRDSSVFVQEVKVLMRHQLNWPKMEAYQREALDMILHKIARILYGDPNFREHWDDVAGYAERAARTIDGDVAP